MFLLKCKKSIHAPLSLFSTGEKHHHIWDCIVRIILWWFICKNNANNSLKSFCYRADGMGVLFTIFIQGDTSVTDGTIGIRSLGETVVVGITQQQQCNISYSSLRASHITDEKWAMMSSFDCWPPTRQHRSHPKRGVVSYQYRLCIGVIHNYMGPPLILLFLGTK